MTKRDAAGERDLVEEVGEDPVLNPTRSVRELIEFYEAAAGLLKSAEAQPLVRYGAARGGGVAWLLSGRCRSPAKARPSHRQ